jgi:hypothetical protein
MKSGFVCQGDFIAWRTTTRISVVLSGLVEGDVGSLLHDEAEASFGCGEVGHVPIRVPGQIRLAALLELGEPL